jgi:hypothetical protein
MGFGIKSGSKLIFYSAWVGWIWKSVHLKAGRAEKLHTDVSNGGSTGKPFMPLPDIAY